MLIMHLSHSNRKKIQTMQNNYYIDDITWNDLSMEQVYEKINSADSSVGQEYLKKILRTTTCDQQALEKRSARARWLTANADAKTKLRKCFKELGKTKKISLYDYIFRFNEVKQAGNVLHYLLIVLLLAAIILIFISPVIGVLAVVLMFAVNISTYFKFKAQIEGYFMCFKYIVKMLQTASKICRLGIPADSELTDLIQLLSEDVRQLAAIKRGSWLLTNSVSGSLVDVLMDYARMLFHVDIIRFNSMRKIAEAKASVIDELFCTLGELEADICISDFREQADGWCEPSFDQKTRSVSASGMYHPLTHQIVKNDMSFRRSVLLTGSNASGKSTFLKQLAINQIFAQTIYTCLADEFHTRFYSVMSSMALTDNILGNESYFIVEIKSLKRILDAVDDSEGAVPVMCFIDEVLRGTNTKERIAASSQILRSLSNRNALCFAATHDIELTSLLSDNMDNYHFEEYVDGNDVNFDYKIKKGPAMTHNAIKLMQSYGFDRNITENALQMLEDTL